MSDSSRQSERDARYVAGYLIVKAEKADQALAVLQRLPADAGRGSYEGGGRRQS